MKELDIYQVDAFTDVIFGGNPAGVVTDATGLTEDVMQKIAREMALSETAFIIDKRGSGPRSGRAGDADFDVRFFTPWNEVDLCGHATIGGFWLLAELGIIDPREAASGSISDERCCRSLQSNGSAAQADHRHDFSICDERGSMNRPDCLNGSAGEFLDTSEIRVFQRTKAGLLPVDILAGCGGGLSRVMMTQALPKVVLTLSGEEVRELEAILGAAPGSVSGFVGLNGVRAVPQGVTTGLPDLIVPVSSREALLSMRPNNPALIDFCNARELISVHCFSLETLDPAATVHCRDFSPAVGVPEESATGTASGATGAYLVLNKLVPVKEPVTKIVCEQGHILKRPSTIYVKVESRDGEIKSVRVGGSAVTVVRGKIRVP